MALLVSKSAAQGNAADRWVRHVLVLSSGARRRRRGSTTERECGRESDVAAAGPRKIAFSTLAETAAGSRTRMTRTARTW